MYLAILCRQIVIVPVILRVTAFILNTQDTRHIHAHAHIIHNCSIESITTITEKQILLVCTDKYFSSSLLISLNHISMISIFT